MPRSNDTIAIIAEQLETKEKMEKYLPLIISRMDESKRILNKSLIFLTIIVIVSLFLALSDIDYVTTPLLEKIDERTVFVFAPSIFSIVYYYYILTWMHYVQQRKIYKHLTSLLFSTEVESHLNDHIQPFNLLEIIVKYHDSENENFSGCLTSFIMIPIFFIILLIPISFVSFLLWSNQSELNLNGWEDKIGFVVPIIIVILLALLIKKSIVLNILGKEK